MALIKCTECGKKISEQAISCPNCGAPVTLANEATASSTQNEAPKQKPKKKGSCLKTILIVIATFILLGFIGSMFGGDDSESPKNENVENVDTPSEAETESEPIEEVPAVEEPTEDESEQEDPNIPREYESALNKAYSYSDTMYMSKAAIYDQLTSEYGEQFSEEAAQYAMDNIVVDWNTNALRKAESYSETMYMSKQAIYDQLISEYGEKFTEEEAQYAIDNIQADWNANALEKAKSYQDNMDMSPAAIHDQLTSEYGEQFTKEEADYAIEHLE